MSCQRFFGGGAKRTRKANIIVSTKTPLMVFSTILKIMTEETEESQMLSVSEHVARVPLHTARNRAARLHLRGRCPVMRRMCSMSPAAEARSRRLLPECSGSSVARKQPARDPARPFSEPDAFSYCIPSAFSSASAWEGAKPHRFGRNCIRSRANESTQYPHAVGGFHGHVFGLVAGGRGAQRFLQKLSHVLGERHDL